MTALRHRILVIDDEPQIHRFLGPALDAAGYEPLRADSGQEGLRGIALWSPDAVVLDLGLPDMDGKDLLEKARSFYDGPILILSARDREIERFGVGLDGVGRLFAERGARGCRNSPAAGQSVELLHQRQLIPCSAFHRRRRTGDDRTG